jgi:hypothetical protein
MISGRRLLMFDCIDDSFTDFFFDNPSVRKDDSSGFGISIG